ncbi:MAG: helix-turn-helix domain-containing protein [Gemmataceae bacterium]
MTSFDPNRPDFSPYGYSCVRWTPTRMPRCDRHNEIELNLLERGAVVYLMGGRRVTVPAGRLTAFWAGVPHQILDFETDDAYFVMTVPLTRFLQWQLPDGFTRAILHGEPVIEPDAGLLAVDRGRFETWLGDLDAGSEDRRRVSLLEVEARLRRLAMSRPPAGSEPRRRPRAAVRPRHLNRAEEMAYFVARNYTGPLTAEAVARHVGLHPNYAMAVFQQAFGTTLLKYVTQHRLSHAQRLLVTTGDSVLAIAFASGFGSLSRFNEAFRGAAGCTPREYRRAHQS